MEFAALLQAVHRELRPLDDIPGRRAAEAAGAARERLRAAGVPAPGDGRASAPMQNERAGRDAVQANRRGNNRRIDRGERAARRIDSPEAAAQKAEAAGRTAEPEVRETFPVAESGARPVPDEPAAEQVKSSSAGPVAPAQVPAEAATAPEAGARGQAFAGPRSFSAGQVPTGRIESPAAAAPVGVPQAGPGPAGSPGGAQMAGADVQPIGPEVAAPGGAGSDTSSRGSGGDGAFRAALDHSARVRGSPTRPGGPPQGEGKTADGVDLRESGAVERLARVVRSQAGARTGKLVLHLDPPELGRVRIDVRLREGALSVTLEADQEAGFQAVRDHLDELRQALGRQGLQVDRLDVELRAPAIRDGSDAGGSGDRSAGGEQPPPRWHSGSPDTRGSAGGSSSGEPGERMGFARVENEVGGWTRPAESGVDLVA